MLIKIRVAGEQYEYFEVEYDTPMTAEEIAEKYQELHDAYHVGKGVGLSQKDFNKVVDEYLVSANLSEEEYTTMSTKQQYVIQELKRAFKRSESAVPSNIQRDKDGILEDVEDLYQEHEQHSLKYEANCSTCYSERFGKK